MGILVKEGTTKRDWFKLAGATAEAAIKSLTLGKDGFSAAIPPLFRILESLRGEDSTERRAARFVLEVLSYSIAQTLQSIQLTRAPLQPEVEAIVQQLLARVENLCDQQEVFLTAADLEHPSSFEIFDDISSRIFHELKPNGPKAREAARFSHWRVA
ncbi:hypothetical protein [Bradyrhizobium sp. CCBAU 51765]|uniref:hypothetical protein n=1 Tax=Bradyrhizobium sp. CCBAU 51765 TaxID=1325102 RepID=UPI001888AB64|nr:hypothetical protein [Bradyrhizobium sp. CCBAU 51765]